MVEPDIIDLVQIMSQLKPEHHEPFTHNLVDGYTAITTYLGALVLVQS